jgi:hypothetical protein
MMGQLSDTASTRHEYIPGSGASSIMASSRRSPNIRSEIDSLKFDLDEEDYPTTTKNENKISSRKGARSVIRSNYKVNEGK